MTFIEHFRRVLRTKSRDMAAIVVERTEGLIHRGSMCDHSSGAMICMAYLQGLADGIQVGKELEREERSEAPEAETPDRNDRL
jgi:hypothetical protein